jgi:L-iditol 2-dehydrogenase
MKVARLHGVGDLRLHDEPKPSPSSGDTLLRVQAVGLCGSDLHWLGEGGIGDAQLIHPLILGHEFAAATDDGARVAVDPAISCGQCEACRSGNPNLCARVILAGHGAQDGALREFMAWPTDRLYPLPDSLSYADGAMLEPLGVALHAVDLGKIIAGMTIAVFGCGPIGLLIVQLARVGGATSIIATDVLSHRVEAARNFGAQHAFLAHGQDEIGEVRSATGGRGVDVAFEVAGEQEAVDAAFAAAMPGGRVVLAGIPADDRTSFQASVARRKGLTIKMVRRMKLTYPRAMRLVERGLVDVRSLVTHRFSLMDVKKAFEVALRREGLKVIVEPAQEAS